MQLAKLIQKETGVGFDQIMLLRHSNDRIESVRKYGATVQGYTSIQPKDLKYDFVKHGIKIVAVIVEASVYAVYRVVGVEKEDRIDLLATDPLRQVYAAEGDDRPGRQFRMERLQSICDDRPIKGWEGKEISTPLRSRKANGKPATLFWEIEVDLPRDKSNESGKRSDSAKAGSARTKNHATEELSIH